MRTFDPFSNLIEVYVNRVRRKIDADSSKPLLHTRRGAGYLFGPLNEFRCRGGGRRKCFAAASRQGNFFRPEEPCLIPSASGSRSGTRPY